jgi:predicted transcriptional regulator
VRTLVDLPDAQIEALAALCERVKQPRAAIIRAAVAEYLERHADQPIEAAFGIWGQATPDGLDHQRAIRAEW